MKILRVLSQWDIAACTRCSGWIVAERLQCSASCLISYSWFVIFVAHFFRKKIFPVFLLTYAIWIIAAVISDKNVVVLRFFYIFKPTSINFYFVVNLFQSNWRLTTHVNYAYLLLFIDLVLIGMYDDHLWEVRTCVLWKHVYLLGRC